MRQTPRRRGFSDSEFHTLVGQALLHLDDVAWLADSQLMGLPAAHRRLADNHMLFADGYALRDHFTQMGQAVIKELEPIGKLGLNRAALEGVCAAKSVACIAREQGKSREHLSRRYWSLAARLVADELTALSGRGAMSYTVRRVR